MAPLALLLICIVLAVDARSDKVSPPVFVFDNRGLRAAFRGRDKLSLEKKAEEQVRDERLVKGKKIMISSSILIDKAREECSVVRETPPVSASPTIIHSTPPAPKRGILRSSLKQGVPRAVSFTENPPEIIKDLGAISSDEESDIQSLDSSDRSSSNDDSSLRTIVKALSKTSDSQRRGYYDFESPELNLPLRFRTHITRNDNRVAHNIPVLKPDAFVRKGELFVHHSIGLKAVRHIVTSIKLTQFIRQHRMSDVCLRVYGIVPTEGDKFHVFTEAPRALPKRINQRSWKAFETSYRMHGLALAPTQNLCTNFYGELRLRDPYCISSNPTHQRTFRIKLV